MLNNFKEKLNLLNIEVSSLFPFNSYLQTGIINFRIFCTSIIFNVESHFFLFEYHTLNFSNNTDAFKSSLVKLPSMNL